MSEEHQLPSDSDDDDEDYIPDGLEEAVSEAESEGVVESGPEDENDENKKETSKKGKKRSKSLKKSNKRRKKVDENETVEKEIVEEEKKLTEEEEKKRADSLWADFMKDTAVIPKAKPQETRNGLKEKSPPPVRPKVEEKVKITKIFEFAGEEVKVEKEVPVDSAEARLSLTSAENSSQESSTPVTKRPPAVRGRRGGLGGISSVLGQLGKKAKISTLEKSKLDWDSFKREENLEEEITTHNKGRDGYLERQDFLQRADLRQFEIEKQLRNSNRRSAR